MDRGLAYAEACFETFRVIDGHIFDWSGHWQRLALGMAEFGLLVSPEQGEAVLTTCLREAALVGDDALVRLTISSGEAAWGLTRRSSEPVAHIQCMAYAKHASPLCLRLASWPFALQTKRAKFVSDYADTLRALHATNPAASDANVLFEQGGVILATATANVLFYRHGCWHTPPDTVGVLAGRVRDFLLRRDLVHETICPVAWLDDCEAMAVCNSGVFVRAVAQVEQGGSVNSAGSKKALDIHHPALDLLTDALGAAEGVRL